MSVSLCMIVKNEEENLARCLNSVKDLIDEIILVDTGSTDRTLSIAQRYGAKIYRRAWNDSFSEARNYSLSQADGTWILVMDADDELEPADRGALAELFQKENSPSDVYGCKTLCYSGEQADCCNLLVTTTVRLIRNGRGYFYRGRVHEQLEGPGGPPRISATDIHFYHYGYLSAQIKKKEKHRRNLALIRMELKDHPRNGFMLFNLGNEFLALGKAEDALNCYRASYRALEPTEGYGSMLLTRMILCCDQLHLGKEMHLCLCEGLRLYPDLPDFEYLKGCALQRSGKLLSAIRAYRNCIRMGPPPDGNSLYGVSTFKAHDRLAVLYARLGEWKLALRHCRKAIRFNPCDREAAALMADLLKAEGHTPEQIKTHLLRLVPKDACHLLMLSDLFYDRDMFRQAMQMAIRAQKQVPGCPAACRDEGICRFFLGQYRRAFRCLLQDPCGGNFTSRTRFFRFLCVLLDPAAPPRMEKCRAGLEEPDYSVAAAFRALLRGEPCASLSSDRSQSQGYADAIFGLLEILLRAELLEEFIKALPLLNLIRYDDAPLRLGKLYHKYGYEKLACHELMLSLRTTGKIDAQGFALLSRFAATAAKSK